jgi:hypothetical protein
MPDEFAAEFVDRDGLREGLLGADERGGQDGNSNDCAWGHD